MKKIVSIILASVLVLSLLSGCGKLKDPPDIGFIVPEQFSEYKLGTVEKLCSKDSLTERIEDPIIVKFSSVEKGLNALRNKKISGMVLPAVYKENELKKSEDFAPMKFPVFSRKLCAISKNTYELIVPVDAVLTSITRNGTALKIGDFYSPYKDDENAYVRPTDYKRVEGRKITIGICGDEKYPYNFHENGELKGINVEVAYEIAAGIQAELVIKEYPEDELMNVLDAGEVDYVMSQFYDDEQKPIEAKFLCSQSYYDASTYVLLRNPMLDLKELAKKKLEESKKAESK